MRGHAIIAVLEGGPRDGDTIALEGTHSLKVPVFNVAPVGPPSVRCARYEPRLSLTDNVWQYVYVGDTP